MPVRVVHLRMAAQSMTSGHYGEKLVKDAAVLSRPCSWRLVVRQVVLQGSRGLFRATLHGDLVERCV